MVNEYDLRGQIFILDFVYTSRKLIEVYKFYENWSTETFGKNSEKTSSFERVIDDARLVLWRGSPPAVPNETEA